MAEKITIPKVVYLHIKSIFQGRWTAERLKRAFIIFRQREGRGSGFITQFWDYLQKGAMFSIIFTNILHIQIPIMVYIWIGIIYMVTSYFVGFFDEFHIKLWQMENELGTKRVNPYYQKLENKMNRIEKKVNSLCEKEKKI